jgi:hypothetical protein
MRRSLVNHFAHALLEVDLQCIARHRVLWNGFLQLPAGDLAQLGEISGRFGLRR